VALERGDFATARALHEDSLALKQELGNKWDATTSHFNLGFVAVEEREYEVAQAHYIESLRLAREIGYKLFIVYNLVGLAGVVVQVGSALAIPATLESRQRAARLVAAAEAILAKMKAAMEPFIRRQCDRAVAMARVVLDEEAFNAAWAEGEKMTLDEAVAYALEDDPAVSCDVRPVRVAIGVGVQSAA
jgi:hypothetical protein